MTLDVYFTDIDVPRLHATQPATPSSTKCTLDYLNEGGANFVFRLLPATESPSVPERLQGKLLRLRKDLSHVQSALEQFAAFNECFRPLFPVENLIEHNIICLGAGVAERLNAMLRPLERPSHRLQDSLPLDEKEGLLVTDMTPRTEDVLLQIKPKWLSQSRNALANAKRCRTCALRAQRTSQSLRTTTDAQENCPLGLVSDDVGDRRHAARIITPDGRLQEQLVDAAQPLLLTLREHQSAFDIDGILNTVGEPAISDLCKAMTLRDCTLFLRRSNDNIEARLADLDLKQPEKFGRWKQVERDLVDDGWYANTEDPAVWRIENTCLLSR